MRFSTVLLAAACVLLGANHVQADTLRYEFSGTVDGTSTAISGWIEWDEADEPTVDSSVPGLGQYLTGSSPPFMDWEVTIGSDTYGPDGDFNNEGLFVRDRGSSDTLPDEVQIFSSYKKSALDIVLTASDDSAFPDVDIPELEKIDWDKMAFVFSDFSVDPEKVYRGTLDSFTLVPVPPAALLGLGMLGGLGLIRRLRRRR
jgi:hypothetical protein